MCVCVLVQIKERFYLPLPSTLSYLFVLYFRKPEITLRQIVDCYESMISAFRYVGIFRMRFFPEDSVGCLLNCPRIVVTNRLSQYKSLRAENLTVDCARLT